MTVSTKSNGHNGGSTLCGVILAGGHRWGANELEGLMPRAMLPIVGSPLLCYSLRYLRDAGIREAVVCANSATRAVADLLGDGEQFGMNIQYFEDITPRGPAGCIREAGELTDADDLLVIEASSIIRGRLNALLDHHNNSSATLTLGVARDTASQSGALLARPTGIFLCNRRAIEHIKVTGYSDVKESLIPALRQHGKHVSSVNFGSDVIRVSDFDSYLAANDFVIRELTRNRTPLTGFTLTRQAYVHKTARVSDRAKLIGPVWIGAEAEIAAGATLVGPVCIGNRSVIASGAIVCSSVLWDESVVGEGAIIDTSVLSTGAQVGAGESTYHALQTSAARTRTRALVESLVATRPANGR